ncbi:hypothetical protein H4R27_002405, partial [Coemansia aciculifera]
MDGKLDSMVEKMDRQTDILVSLVQRTAAPDPAPANSAYLAAHDAASGATGIARGASLTTNTRPTTPGTRSGDTRPPPPSTASGSTGVAQGSSSAINTRPATPGTRSGNIRPPAHSTASSSTVVVRAASPAVFIRPTTPGTRSGNTRPPPTSTAPGSTVVVRAASPAVFIRPATPGTRSGNIRPPPPSTASALAVVSQGSSLASDTRPATPGTRSGDTCLMVSKGKGRPRQEDIPEPLPVSKCLAVDETELPWDDEGCGYSPVASTSAAMLRAQPSRAAQSGLGARMPVRGHGSTNEFCDAM